MFRLLRLLSYPLRSFLWKAIWHSVYFFLCRPKLSMALFLSIFVWLGYEIATEKGNGIVTLPKATAKEEKNLTKLPPFSTPIKNGNSRFSSDISKFLDRQSLEFYSYHFQNAMSHQPDNQRYIWQAHEKLFGEITAQKPFISSSGVKCRHFEETTQTSRGAQRLKGISCMHKNGNGWCKLRKTSALTCEIKPISGWANWKLDTKSWVKRNLSFH